MAPIEITNRTYRDVLLISIAAGIIRSIEFISIGSYAPGLVTIGFGTVILTGIAAGWSWVRHVMKAWAVLLILFGVLRYALILMLHVTSVEEIHILEQFTLLFNVFNILTILTGVYLFRATRSCLIFSGS